MPTRCGCTLSRSSAGRGLAETDRTAARNYITALQEGGRSANTIRQAKVVLGAMFGMAVAEGYLDYNPFHDVKIPKVPGWRAIKIATPEQYLKVRGRLPAKPAQVFSTLLVSSGMRFCEAIGLENLMISISGRASWKWPGLWC